MGVDTRPTEVSERFERKRTKEHLGGFQPNIRAGRRGECDGGGADGVISFNG